MNKSNTPAVTNVARMESLEAAVVAFNDARKSGDMVAYEFYTAINDAIWSARANAVDTMAENKYEPNEEVEAGYAYGSICCTPSFDAREDVRTWFTAQGYRW